MNRTTIASSLKRLSVVALPATPGGSSTENASLVKAATGGPVALYAEFTALPEHADAVEALIAGLARDVRQEPGNLIFEPHRRVSNPAAFFVYEVYRNADAFQAHITAPYGAVFNAALGDLIEGTGSELTWLTPVSAEAVIPAV
ncbi:putative quinol monooxygenase [Cryobacterium sp. CG_9.6]|uniref:putative quinol monooxygenase n=1 Tax=Cryobacterium sp. CG_9.6 TaxID=2760710 RepID=UPI002475A5A4|nr:putative quinol monooxygenase [Cryobacterium sp. CG_9.6]MDH6235660.1 quinol monooxygenase YgiN [Cryobacterium sp. CG_9.6]